MSQARRGECARSSPRPKAIAHRKWANQLGGRHVDSGVVPLRWPLVRSYEASPRPTACSLVSINTTDRASGRPGRIQMRTASGRHKSSAAPGSGAASESGRESRRGFDYEKNNDRCRPSAGRAERNWLLIRSAGRSLIRTVAGDGDPNPIANPSADSNPSCHCDRSQSKSESKNKTDPSIINQAESSERSARQRAPEQAGDSRLQSHPFGQPAQVGETRGGGCFHSPFHSAPRWPAMRAANGDPGARRSVRASDPPASDP